MSILPIKNSNSVKCRTLPQYEDKVIIHSTSGITLTGNEKLCLELAMKMTFEHFEDKGISIDNKPLTRIIITNDGSFSVDIDESSCLGYFQPIIIICLNKVRDLVNIVMERKNAIGADEEIRILLVLFVEELLHHFYFSTNEKFIKAKVHEAVTKFMFKNYTFEELYEDLVKQ